MDHATLDMEDYEFEQPEFSAPQKRNIVVLNQALGNYSWFMIFILVSILVYICYITYKSSTSLFSEDPHMKKYTEHTMESLKKKKQLKYRY